MYVELSSSARRNAMRREPLKKPPLKKKSVEDHSTNRRPSSAAILFGHVARTNDAIFRREREVKNTISRIAPLGFIVNQAGTLLAAIITQRAGYKSRIVLKDVGLKGHSNAANFAVIQRRFQCETLANGAKRHCQYNRKARNPCIEPHRTPPKLMKKY
jgi:hypothetical protein